MGLVDRYRVSLGAALYRMIPSLREKKGLEETFPHQNWPIIFGLLVFRNIAFIIVTPSLYQFITSKDEEDKTCKDNSTFWPGLGSSETVYSWVYMIYYLFQMVSIPIAIIMAERIPYIITILITLSAYIVSGVLYGEAISVWMVIVSRSLKGGCSAIVEILVLGYVGEMGTQMDVIRERQGKSPKKFVLYVAYSFAYNIAYILAYGCTSIVLQIPSMDPYRWPGWFIVILAVLCAATVILAFREPRSFGQLKSYVKCKPCKKLKLSLTLETGWKIQLIIYSVLITLLTPILSDQFGFSVEYTSYYLIAQSAAFIVGSVVLLIAKFYKLNNWLLLEISLILVLIGVIIMADWQAIGHDHCLEDWKSNSSNNSDELFLSNDNCSKFFREICENQSTSSYQCFWNSQSRITGEFCSTCRDTCLSKHKAMDFYQLSIGVLLISVMVPIGFFSIPAILSDITSVESQSRVQMVYIGGFSISSVVTPLWREYINTGQKYWESHVVDSYDATGHHIYIPMAATALPLIVLIVSLLLLYKILAPESIRTEVSDLTHASINVSATLAILFGCTWCMN